MRRGRRFAWRCLTWTRRSRGSECEALRIADCGLRIDETRDATPVVWADGDGGGRSGAGVALGAGRFRGGGGAGGDQAGISGTAGAAGVSELRAPCEASGLSVAGGWALS